MCDVLLLFFFQAGAQRDLDSESLTPFSLFNFTCTGYVGEILCIFHCLCLLFLKC